MICNATRANLDNGPPRVESWGSLVVPAPRVACAGSQHRTGCIGETKVRLSQRTPVTTCKRVLQVHVNHLPSPWQRSGFSAGDTDCDPTPPHTHSPQT